MSAIIRRTLLTCGTVLCTDQTLWISVENPSRIMCARMRACARTLWGRASPPPKQQRSESEKTESEKRWKNLDRSRPEVEEYIRLNPAEEPLVDPSFDCIDVTLLLLTWYRLFRRCDPPKDEEDINELKELAH